MTKTKSSSKGDKATRRHSRGQTASKLLGDSTTVASGKIKAKRKVGDGPVIPTLRKAAKMRVGDGPVVPVLGASFRDGVVVPVLCVRNGIVVPTLGKAAPKISTAKKETEDDPFYPGGVFEPMLEPLRKIHRMINEGSVTFTLVANPQNRLSAEKLKELTQELGKHGFNIDIKGE